MLYWTNASGNEEWENDANWFTSDPGGASNPNGAANISSGNGWGPWTANDAYKSANLTLSSNETGAPGIGYVQNNVTIGATDGSWAVTGTCDIPGVVAGSPSTVINDGTFSGEGFTNNNTTTFGGNGATISGNGLDLFNCTINALTVAGEGASFDECTINNMTVSGDGANFLYCSIYNITVSGNGWSVSGSDQLNGSFTGSNGSSSGNTNYNTASFTGNNISFSGDQFSDVYISGSGDTFSGISEYNGTFAPVGQIAFSALVIGGLLQWGASGTATADPGFALYGGTYSPILSVTGIPSGGISGITKFGTD